MTKNNNAPDKHIQEQNDQLTSQRILKQVNDLCDNITRQFNNAMAYREDPVNVVPAEDVHKAVEVEMRLPAKYLQAIEQLNSNLTVYNNRIGELRLQVSDLNTRYSNLCNSYSNLARVTLENEILRESNLALGKELEEAQVRGLKRLWKDIERGIRILFTKSGAKRAACIALISMFVASGIAISYYSWLSIDAYARKAYRFAVDLDFEHPELVYQDIREEYESDGYRAAVVLFRKLKKLHEESMFQGQIEEEAEK
ncbi:MAG: hypothetical protein ACI4UJ_03680 [Candidatus Cryptobacteroides sp.]